MNSNYSSGIRKNVDIGNTQVDKKVPEATQEKPKKPGLVKYPTLLSPLASER